MNDINRLYERLSSISDDCFFEIEEDFFMLLYNIPKKKKTHETIAFLTVCSWHGTSLRSGVWTFYESADPDDLAATAEYLKTTNETELADIFTQGIHDYQNPIYSENFDYPDEWMDESDSIDDWIAAHENQLNNWKRNFLTENRTIISELVL